MTTFLICIIVILLILLIAAANSHPNRHESSRNFSRVSVKGVYKRTDESGVEDSLTLKFFKPGKYIINFEITPGGEYGEANYSNTIPPHTELTVDVAGLEHVISMRRIAKDLRVTINCGDKAEYQDFR